MITTHVSSTCLDNHKQNTAGLDNISISSSGIHGAFEWVNGEDLSLHDIMKYNEETDDIVLEVDLECPNELHELHNDYPLACERCTNQKEIIVINSVEHFTKERLYRSYSELTTISKTWFETKENKPWHQILSIILVKRMD